jgi:hypothetical protein
MIDASFGVRQLVIRSGRHSVTPGLLANAPSESQRIAA